MNKSCECLQEQVACCALALWRSLVKVKKCCSSVSMWQYSVKSKNSKCKAVQRTCLGATFGGPQGQASHELDGLAGLGSVTRQTQGWTLHTHYTPVLPSIGCEKTHTFLYFIRTSIIQLYVLYIYIYTSCKGRQLYFPDPRMCATGRWLVVCAYFLVESGRLFSRWRNESHGKLISTNSHNFLAILRSGYWKRSLAPFQW